MNTYEPLDFGPAWLQTGARAGAAVAVAAAFLGAALTAGPGNWVPLAQAQGATRMIDPPQVVIVAKRDVNAQAGTVLLASNDSVHCATNTRIGASGQGESAGNLHP